MDTWKYSIDKFLDRTPRRDYNCLDFVREVWQDMTGLDIVDRLQGLQGGFKSRHATVDGVKGFKRLAEPANPCIAVFQRRSTTPHMGVFLNGRILHMHDHGVEFQPLVVAKQYFKRVSYYV